MLDLILNPDASLACPLAPGAPTGDIPTAPHPLGILPPPLSLPLLGLLRLEPLFVLIPARKQTRVVHARLVWARPILRKAELQPPALHKREHR